MTDDSRPTSDERYAEWGYEPEPEVDDDEDDDFPTVHGAAVALALLAIVLIGCLLTLVWVINR